MSNVFQKFFQENPENPEIKVVKEHEPPVRMLGKIIKLSHEGGWGFITSKQIKFTRIFFHWTALKQDTLNFTDLKNGMYVEFTPIKVEDNRYRAIKISIVELTNPEDN